MSNIQNHQFAPTNPEQIAITFWQTFWNNTGSPLTCERMERNNTHRNNSQRSPSMSEQPSSQRAQTGSLQTTEYRENFIDPRSYKTLVLPATKTDPFNPLAGTKYTPTTNFR
nr:PREDICTED: uncharacterized protein LOC109625575 isoform X2 [Paralichthys olivaceus]